MASTTTRCTPTPRSTRFNKKFAALPTSSARTAAYKKAQEQIAADVPYVPIVDTGTVAVVKPGIEGVSFSPGGSGRYWTMHPAGASTAITDAFTG